MLVCRPGKGTPQDNRAIGEIGQSNRAQPANPPTLWDSFFRFRLNDVNLWTGKDINRASRRHLSRLD